MANGVHFEFLLAGLCDSSGSPLNGGKVYTYSPGTTTPKATYQDITQVTPHANPIVLDSSGRKLAFGLGGYKFVIKDASDNTLATFDNVYEYIGDPSAVPSSHWNLGGSVYIYGSSYSSSLRTVLVSNGILQNGGILWGGTSSGAANVQTLSLSPTPSALATGMLFRFKAGFANTADSPTLNVDGIGAKTMVRGNGLTLRKGDLIAGGIYEAIYDGTNIFILNPTPTWQTWTPSAQTASGAMTVSSVTNREHKYCIGLDGVVHFEATADFTLGGTGDPSIYISLPTAASAHAAQVGFICSADENGGRVANGGRWRVDATPRIVLFKPGAANWTLGAAASYSIKGSYQLG